VEHCHRNQVDKERQVFVHFIWHVKITPDKKIKKHVSSMLGFQAKSAKNNAAKDELSLL